MTWIPEAAGALDGSWWPFFSWSCEYGHFGRYSPDKNPHPDHLRPRAVLVTTTGFTICLKLTDCLNWIHGIGRLHQSNLSHSYDAESV